MATVARHRAAIESTGTQLAFVHMSAPDEADRWFHKYEMADVARFSDPEKTLYREFGLEQASLRALMHPRVLWPWVRTAILQGYGVGAAGPNWRQLTGVFVVHRDRILASVRHRNSAAHPDYLAIVRGLKLR
jgi:AhpC/TSA antioxidant enzyme